MINAKEVKQRAIIAALVKYEEEIDIISEAITRAADDGKFMLYFDPKLLKIRREEWTAILNAFDNSGFKTGIKDNKLIFSWFHDLAEINLIEDYEKIRIG